MEAQSPALLSQNHLHTAAFTNMKNHSHLYITRRLTSYQPSIQCDREHTLQFIFRNTRLIQEARLNVFEPFVCRTRVLNSTPISTVTLAMSAVGIKRVLNVSSEAEVSDIYLLEKSSLIDLKGHSADHVKQTDRSRTWLGAAGKKNWIELQVLTNLNMVTSIKHSLA